MIYKTLGTKTLLLTVRHKLYIFSSKNIFYQIVFSNKYHPFNIILDTSFFKTPVANILNTLVVSLDTRSIKNVYYFL